MKHFKFFVINVIAFSILLMLFSLLFPSRVVTTKTILINAGKDKVIEKLNTTNEWENWNRFVVQNTVMPNPGTTGDSLVFTFENRNNKKLQANFYIYTEINTLLLNWALIEKLPWYMPWRKFSAMVLNKDVAAAMDTSLNLFKSQVENQK